MKAKQVSEALGNLFKPKTKEEILNSLETLKISSYRLSTYLNLNKNHDPKKLTIKRFCDELNIDTTKMEITMGPGGNIETIFDIAFDRFRKYVVTYHSYEYLPVYNIMQYKQNSSYHRVFIFPKDKINKILHTIINDPLTDI